MLLGDGDAFTRRFQIDHHRAQLALGFVGAASISFMSTGNSTLQLGAEPSMRGRVMALWFVAFQGSTPIGGPIVGWVMAVAGARAGLGLGAITCVAVAVMGAAMLLRSRDRLRADSPRPAIASGAGVAGAEH